MIYKAPNSESRTLFESWLTANHTSACVVRTRKGYISETTRVAWRAWQAATAQAKGGAAPELLEALEEARQFIESELWPEHEFVVRLRALCAKAKGAA